MKHICEGVTRYAHGDFIITVIEKNSEGTYEAWLNHKDYGVASLMFGVPQNSVTGYKGFLLLVKANLPVYTKYYREEYCEECC